MMMMEVVFSIDIKLLLLRRRKVRNTDNNYHLPPPPLRLFVRLFSSSNFFSPDEREKTREVTECIY